MSNKVSGMVMKVEKNKDVIMITPSGEFIKGYYEGCEAPLPGQEIEISAYAKETKKVSYFTFRKPVALVAALLIFFICLSLYGQFVIPSPAAYIALDINPSLELALDEKGYVIDTNALNTDAQEILKDLNVKGLFYKNALKEIINEMEQKGIISPYKENIIQVTLAAQDKYPITMQDIENAVKEHLEEKNLSALYRIDKVQIAERNKAQEEKVSLNQISLKEELAEKGIKLKESEIKEPPAEIIKKYRQENLFKKFLPAHKQEGKEKKDNNKEGKKPKAKNILPQDKKDNPGNSNKPNIRDIIKNDIIQKDNKNSVKQKKEIIEEVLKKKNGNRESENNKANNSIIRKPEERDDNKNGPTFEDKRKLPFENKSGLPFESNNGPPFGKDKGPQKDEKDSDNRSWNITPGKNKVKLPLAGKNEQPGAKQRP